MFPPYFFQWKTKVHFRALFIRIGNFYVSREQIRQIVYEVTKRWHLATRLFTATTQRQNPLLLVHGRWPTQFRWLLISAPPTLGVNWIVVSQITAIFESQCTFRCYVVFPQVKSTIFICDEFIKWGFIRGTIIPCLFVIKNFINTKNI